MVDGGCGEWVSIQMIKFANAKSAFTGSGFDYL